MPTFPLPADLVDTVSHSLDEDVGPGDLTAALIPAAQQAQGHIIAREPGILCGTPWATEAFRQVDDRIQVEWMVQDGARIDENQMLGRLSGPARGILTAERTALNFLQTLSGTATLARRYADTVAGTPAMVIDTRKTLPGLRRAQKYAVAIGGCGNHRMGLYDFILIKENHIAAAGGVAAALEAARAQQAGVPIEIEVETLTQLEEALQADAERVLLDNFDLEGLREAVRVNAGRAKLEAAGNVSVETRRSIAETGVGFISVGALSKHVEALDLSLRFVTEA